LPTLETGQRYKTCCGKTICSGCVYAPVYDDQGNEVDNEKCAFCRVPTPYTDEEAIEREKKRLEADDPIAIQKQGYYYTEGILGLSRDRVKALELWHRSAELGYAKAYCDIGTVHYNGEGVVVDKKKGQHYYEQAAMMGDVQARYNLGCMEGMAGNTERALNII